MQVFISYKSEYAELAVQVRDRLRAWGLITWRDKDDIREGEYFRYEIQNGLETSDVVIGILNTAALQSREVMWEWEWGMNEARFIPLRFEDIPLPYHLRSQQYIDFVIDPESGYFQLREALYNPPEAVTPPPARSAERPADPAPPKPHAKSNRDVLLDKVHNAWIAGALRTNLADSAAFELELNVAPGALLRHRDYGDYDLPDSTRDILRVFEDMRRELLILGAPGAGKTVLMLQLADRLIKQARDDDKQPIPVVFNLSSWAAERKPLAKWLADELHIRYQVPRRVATEYVEKELLLLLLDGLDEVAHEYRSACVAAINTFREAYRYVDLVVCSRITDYEVLSERLDLAGAIMLRPLSNEKVREYLSDEKYAAVRAELAHEADLREMAGTPFLLNTIAATYGGKSAMELSPLHGETRLTHLLENFTRDRIRTTSADSPYTPSQTRRYLTWLAQQMVKRSQTTFYIEDLQPDWLGTRLRMEGYHLIAGLLAGGLSGAIVGSSVFVVFYMVAYPHWSMYVLLIAGAVSGGMMGLVAGLNTGIRSTIRMVDNMAYSISPRVLAAALLGALSVILVGGPAIFLTASLVMAGGYDLFARLFLLLTTEPTAIAGIILIGALVGALIGGSDVSPNIDRRNVPAAAIKRTLRMGLTGFFVFPVVGLIIFGSQGRLLQGLCIGLVGGVIVGLSSGLGSIIQHVTLRLLLQRQDVVPSARGPLRHTIPGNYVAFLDHCARIGILRKVGGGYIFRHRYLLEYFAGQELK